MEFEGFVVWSWSCHGPDPLRQGGQRVPGLYDAPRSLATVMPRASGCLVGREDLMDHASVNPFLH